MAEPLRTDPRRTRTLDRLEQLGDEIAELSAHIQAATYRLLVVLREFDQRGGWGPGFASCAHWLSWRTGLDLGAAREKVRVARALCHLPVLSDALRRGAVSYSKVRALTRVATPRNERELLNFAYAGTASHVERLVRAFRRADRKAELDEAKRRQERRYLQAYTDDDGMVVLRGRLDPETGAALLRALDAARDRIYEKDRIGRHISAETRDVTYGQRQADAIGLVAEAALHHDLDPGTRGDRYQVVVHVDADVLDETEDREPDGRPGQSAIERGPRVSAETSRRIACDTSRVVMRHTSDGSVLDVGRKTRIVSPALRRALTHRDHTCRFPGCTCRICDAHHIEHWADGGETKLDNLVLLCRRHHRCVHEEGYRIELLQDGELRVHRPRGGRLPHAPVPPALARDPVEELQQQNRNEGLDIHAYTAPTWNGDRPDWDWILEGFLRR